MFTPSVTAHGPRITASPYAPLSLPPVSQTTLVQQLRRDPPALLTNDQTCGYTSGVWSSAVTCGPSHSCTYYTTPYSAPNFGCCINGEECGYVSTCVDYKASGNPNTIGGYLFMDKGIGSAFPYCSTVLLYGTTYAPGSSYSFYSYGCLTKKLADVVAFQTTLDERAEATTSTSASSAASLTSVAEAASTSNTVSALSNSASASSSGSSETLQTPYAGSSTSSQAGAIASSSPSTSATITSPSSTPSSTTLSQTSQIGIAVGASIGFSFLLAILAFLFWRNRKAKANKKWLDQSPRSADQPHAENKSLHPFDHRFSSLRSASSGVSEAPFELASTGKRHELAVDGGRVEIGEGGRRYELPSDGRRYEMGESGRRHELATSGY
ncbi:hypothetical protein D6D27_08424 [Aureobasidium pullulans]|nr:hypothetical protein D6D27_08424 [Aureobasidium pullulans]